MDPGNGLAATLASRPSVPASRLDSRTVARDLPLSALEEGRWKLDCLGMLCPVPVVKTGQAMRRIGFGDLLAVVADDPGAELDLRDWCDANRQEWVGVEARGGAWTIQIRRIR